MRQLGNPIFYDGLTTSYDGLTSPVTGARKALVRVVDAMRESPIAGQGGRWPSEAGTARTALAERREGDHVQDGIGEGLQAGCLFA